MLIYGGQDLREGPQRGLWELNLATSRWEEDKWTQIDTTDQGALCRHSAIVKGDLMYIFGGSDGDRETNNTMIFNCLTKNWTTVISDNPNVPPALDSHSAALYEDGASSYMIVFGGYVSGDRSNETYMMNLANNKWTHVSINGQSPEPRSNQVSVVYEDHLYVLGGSNEECERLNDLWKLNLKTNVWTQVMGLGEVPNGRSGHSAVVYKEFMIVFGGMRDITRETNDMYSYDFITNTWVCFQGERQVKDPVTAEQLEEYKKAKSSPTSNKPRNGETSPSRSPTKKTTMSPSGEHSPTRRKNALYDGPATPISGRIRGNAPHARDGHSSVLVNTTMIIFGGDRHQMPFNDVYGYTLVDQIVKTPLIKD